MIDDDNLKTSPGKMNICGFYYYYYKRISIAKHSRNVGRWMLIARSNHRRTTVVSKSKRIVVTTALVAAHV